MQQRFNAGQLMVMIGAVALLVSLFLDWYEPDLSAWEVFEVGDVVLAGLAIAALAVALPMRLPDAAAPRALAEQRSLPWIGFAALAFVCVTLVSDPPAARGLSLEFGAWLGLIGAVLLAAGGILSTARISVVISSRPAEPASRTTAPASGATETHPLDDEPPHEA
ncbi:MAG TPA: hypothetical protein VEK39_00430 [Solirubrobacterales bacterium]|nr:hypothetical protein [Solirubrobacterales bacterium]